MYKVSRALLLHAEEEEEEEEENRQQCVCILIPLATAQVLLHQCID